MLSVVGDGHKHTFAIIFAQYLEFYRFRVWFPIFRGWAATDNQLLLFSIDIVRQLLYQLRKSHLITPFHRHPKILIDLKERFLRPLTI